MADGGSVYRPEIDLSGVTKQVLGFEKTLSGIVKTIDMVSSGAKLQDYWLTQEQLITKTTQAYKAYQQVQSQTNANEFLKSVNALKAVAGESFNSILSGIDKGLNASSLGGIFKNVSADVAIAFSPENFSTAFHTLQILGDTGQEAGGKIKTAMDVLATGGDTSQLRSEVERLNNELVTTKNNLVDTKTELSSIKNGTAIESLNEQIETLSSQISLTTSKAMEEFQAFLTTNKVDNNRFGEYYEFFNQIENGAMSATEAIATMKRDFSRDLLVGNPGASGGVGIDPAQLERIMSLLEQTFQKVESLSGAIAQLSQQRDLTLITGALQQQEGVSDSTKQAMAGLVAEGAKLRTSDQLVTELVRNMLSLKEGTAGAYTEMTQLAQSLKDFGSIDVANLEMLERVFTSLGRVKGFDLNAGSLTAFKDTLLGLSNAVTNTSNLSVISNASFKNFEDLKIRPSSLRNLADYLPTISNTIDVDKLQSLAAISWDNLNNLKVSKPSVESIKELADSLSLLKNSQDVINMVLGTGAGQSGGKGRSSLSSQFTKRQKEVKAYINELDKLDKKWVQTQDKGAKSRVPVVDESGNPVKDENNNDVYDVVMRDTDNYLQKVAAVRAELTSAMQLTFDPKTGEAQISSISGAIEAYNNLKTVVKAAGLEMDDFQKKQKDNNATNSLLTQITKFKDGLDGKATHSTVAQFEELIEGLKSGEKTVAETTEMFKKLQQVATEAGETGKNAIQKLFSGFSNKLFYGTMAAAAMLVRRSIRQVYTNVVELDKALTQISIVTKTSGADLENFATQAANVAKATGQSISNILASVETYARLGYDISSSTTLADITAKYSNVAATDVNAATDSITSIMKAYGYAPAQMEGVADMLVKVGQEYAISASELGEAFQNGGAALEAGGNSIEETLALFAAGNAAVQDASKVGNAMKTTSMRIRGSVSELQDMGEEVDGIVTSTSKYRAEIKALSGVDILSDASTYKSTYQILKEIAGVWDQLTDIQQATLLEDLAGKRNAAVVKSVISNLKDLEGSYQAATNAAGTLATANEKYMDSIGGKLGVLSANFQEFSSNVLDSSILKDSIGLVAGLLNLLNKLDDKTNGLASDALWLVGAVVILNGVLGIAAKKVKVIVDAAQKANKTSKLVGLSTFLGDISIWQITAVVAALAALGAMIKMFVDSSRSMKNLTKELAATKEEADGCKKSLSDNAYRIEELQKIKNAGTISLVEEDELNRLKEENELLTAQIALLEEQERLTQNEINSKIADAANDFFTKPRTRNTAVKQTGARKGYVIEKTYTTDSEILQTDLERYKETEAEYEQALKDGNAAAARAANDVKLELFNSLNGQLEILQQYFNDPTWGEAAKKQYDSILVAIGGSDAVSIIWDRLFSAIPEDKQDTIVQAAEAALSGDTGMLQSLIDGDISGELRAILVYLDEIGLIDLENTDIYAVANAIATAAEEIKKVSDSYDTVDDIKTKFEALDSAMKDYKEYGGLTKDTVDSLAGAIPGLLDKLYDEDGALTDAGKAALGSATSLRALAAESIAATTTLNGMNLAQAKAKLEELKQKYDEVMLSITAMRTAGIYAGSYEARRAGDSAASTAIEMAAAQKDVNALNTAIATALAENQKVFSKFTGSSSSSTDSYKQNVEKLLKIEKHRLEMDRITMDMYYESINSINDKYYKDTAAHRKKYEEESLDLDQEYYNGRLSAFQDFVEDRKKISDRYDLIGQNDKAVGEYRSVLERAQSEINYALNAARAKGIADSITENTNYLQTLRQLYKDTCDAIVQEINDAYDEYMQYADNFNLWNDVGFTKTEYLTQWLKDLGKAYDEGLILYDDYVKKYNEVAKQLYDNQRSSISEIIDLTIAMIEQESKDQTEALEKQADDYQTLIDLKKQLLSETEDELDHEEEVAEKTKEIAKLQSKIGQLSLDDSRESTAKRLTLEEELAQKQKELNDLQRGYIKTQTEEALDEEADAFQKKQDEEIKIMEKSIDTWVKKYELAIDMLDNDWNGMYQKLLNYSDEYATSIDGKNSLVTAWDNASEAVRKYGSIMEAYNLAGDLAMPVQHPGDLGSSVYEQQRALVQKMWDNSQAWNSVYAETGSMTDPRQQALSTENQKIADQLRELGMMVDYLYGVWYTDSTRKSELYKYFGIAKYHSGGVVGDQGSINNNEVLACLQKGELVLDEQKQKALKELLDHLGASAVAMAGMRSCVNVPSSKTSAGTTNTFAPNVAVNISHNGNMSDADAKRYGDLAADAALSKLKDAFTKRGV